jgi:hypothetical protein
MNGENLRNKFIFNNWTVRVALESLDFEICFKKYAPDRNWWLGSCEHNNELPGSINREFLN